MFFFLSPTGRDGAARSTTTPSSTTSGATGRPATTARGTSARVKESIGDPEHIVAAIGYYRAMWDPDAAGARTGRRAGGGAAADAQADAVPPRPRRRLHAVVVHRVAARLPGRGLRDGDRRRHRPLPARGAARGRQPPHRPLPDRLYAAVAASPVSPLPQPEDGILPAGPRGEALGHQRRRPPARPAPGPRASHRRAARPLRRTPPRRSASSRRPLPWRSDPANVLCGRAVGLSRHGSATSAPDTLAAPGALTAQRAPRRSRVAPPCTRWRPGRTWPG